MVLTWEAKAPTEIVECRWAVPDNLGTGDQVRR